MTGQLDYDWETQPGLEQTLLGGPKRTDGLAGLLLNRLQSPISGTTAGSGYLRDALLALQNPSIQVSVPVHLPSLAPPAVADSLPQAAMGTGSASQPGSATDQAIVTDMINSQRPDLGLEGNLARAFLSSPFSKDAFENYWLAKGPMQLSDARFADIADVANRHPGEPVAVTPTSGDPLVRRQFSFYGDPDYGQSLGTASLFYSPDGKPVGFYDNYNFDNTPGKKRGWLQRQQIRAMSVLGPLHGARDFPIYYGQYVAPQPPNP